MKVKMKHFIACAALALLTVSCKGLLNVDSDSGASARATKEDGTARIAYLDVSLAGVTAQRASVARTALPDFETATAAEGGYDYSGFTKFELTGKKTADTGDAAVIRTWTSDNTATAYSVLTGTNTDTNNLVPLALYSGSEEEGEAWTFTLTAWYGNYESPSGCITFADTINATIKAGSYTAAQPAQGEDPEVPASNSLVFALERTSGFVVNDEHHYFPYSMDGQSRGGLQLTLGYAGSMVDTTGAAPALKSNITETAKIFTYDDYTAASYNFATTSAVAGVSFTGTGSAAGTIGETEYALVKTWTATDSIFDPADRCLSEGLYVAVFSYEENGSPVGSITEYVYILKDLVSKSNIVVDMDATYSITYKLAGDADPLGETAFADTAWATNAHHPASYSRLENVTLPTQADMGSAITNNYVFVGWYETLPDESTKSADRITGIAKNTYVQEKTYYAWLINKADAAKISSVTVEANTEWKVGHTLTATAKLEDGTENFTGRIYWNWFAGGPREPLEYERVQVTEQNFTTDGSLYMRSGEDYHEITSGVWSSYVNSEVYTVKVDWKAIEGQSSNAGTAASNPTVSYLIPPACAGKQIKVVATPYYSLTPKTADGEDANTDAGDTIAFYDYVKNDYATVTEGAVSTATAAASSTESALIAKGSLQANVGTNAKTTLSYDYSDGTNSTSPTSLVIGTLLDAGNVSIDETNLATIADANTTSGTSLKTLADTAWRGTADDWCTIELCTGTDPDYVVSNEIKAPYTGSDYVVVKLTVKGYEPLYLAESLFIKVRYATPTVADIKSILWGTDKTTFAYATDNVSEGGSISDAIGSVDVREGFDKNYISFYKPEYTHDYEILADGNATDDQLATTVEYGYSARSTGESTDGDTDGDTTPVVTYTTAAPRKVLGASRLAAEGPNDFGIAGSGVLPTDVYILDTPAPTPATTSDEEVTTAGVTRSKITFRAKEKAGDAETGIGTIYASDAIEIDFAEETGDVNPVKVYAAYIGTRRLIADIKLSAKTNRTDGEVLCDEETHEPLTDKFPVGSYVTAVAVDEWGDEIEYEESDRFDWWIGKTTYNEDALVEPEDPNVYDRVHGNTLSYTITQTAYTDATSYSPEAAEGANVNQITVVAYGSYITLGLGGVSSYAPAVPSKQAIKAFTIVKGIMNEPTIEFAENAWTTFADTVATTLETPLRAVKMIGESVENTVPLTRAADGNSVTNSYSGEIVDGYEVYFVGDVGEDKAPVQAIEGGTGKFGQAKIKVTAPGYYDYTADVFVFKKIPIKAEAPSTDSTTGFHFGASGEVAYHAVQFVVPDTTYWYQYEWLDVTIDGETGALTGTWKAVTKEPVAVTDTTLFYTAPAEGESGEGTFTDTANATVRAKLKAIDTAGNEYYYSAGDSTWMNATGTVTYTMAEGASVTIPASYYAEYTITPTEGDAVTVKVTDDPSLESRVAYSKTANLGTNMTVKTDDITFVATDIGAITYAKDGDIIKLTMPEGYTVTTMRIDGMTIDDFNGEYNNGVVVESETLTTLSFNTTKVPAGTYQVFVYGRKDGIPYSAGFSVVVSN